MLSSYCFVCTEVVWMLFFSQTFKDPEIHVISLTVFLLKVKGQVKPIDSLPD